MGTNGKDHGGIFKCITLHKACRAEGLSFLRNGGVTYVAGHGVTEQCCCCDTSTTFVCTSTGWRRITDHYYGNAWRLLGWIMETNLLSRTARDHGNGRIGLYGFEAA